jgi:hypothetical protein
MSNLPLKISKISFKDGDEHNPFIVQGRFRRWPVAVRQDTVDFCHEFVYKEMVPEVIMNGVLIPNLTRTINRPV